MYLYSQLLRSNWKFIFNEKKMYIGSIYLGRVRGEKIYDHFNIDNQCWYAY